MSAKHTITVVDKRGRVRTQGQYSEALVLPLLALLTRFIQDPEDTIHVR